MSRLLVRPCEGRRSSCDRPARRADGDACSAPGTRLAGATAPAKLVVSCLDPRLRSDVSLGQDSLVPRRQDHGRATETGRTDPREASTPRPPGSHAPRSRTPRSCCYPRRCVMPCAVACSRSFPAASDAIPRARGSPDHRTRAGEAYMRSGVPPSCLLVLLSPLCLRVGYPIPPILCSVLAMLRRMVEFARVIPGSSAASYPSSAALLS